MREHSFKIREALRHGLPPDPRVDPGAPWLLDAQNARPMPWGGCTPEQLTYPVSNPELDISWPHPQLLRRDDVTLLGAPAALHSVAPDFSTTPLPVYSGVDPDTEVALTAGGAWQLGARAGVWTATNGINLVCRLPSTDGKVRMAPDTVTVQSVGRQGHRLILGGFSGSWFQGSRFRAIFELWRQNQPTRSFVHRDMEAAENWVAWGEPGGGDTGIPDHVFLILMGVFGEAAFDAWDTEILQRVEEGLIGFSPVSCPGTVKGVQPHGERVLVFSDHGVSVLHQVPETAEYIEDHGHGIGVAGRAAFAGSAREAIWVGPEGDVHRWLLGEGVQRLGFAHLVGELSDPVVSHDPLFDEYWIAGPEGAYVLTLVDGIRRLGGPMTVRPTGLFRDPDEGLVGAALGLDDDVVFQVRTNAYDLGDQDWKYCGQLQVQHDGLQAPEVRLWPREGADAPPVAMGWEQTNELDISYHEASFTDAQFEVRAAVQGPAPARCSMIKVKFGAEGRMHRRGTDAMEETS